MTDEEFWDLIGELGGVADERSRWCEPLVFGGGGDWTAYADAVLEITDDIGSRPEWRAWWEVSGCTTLRLVIELADAEACAVRRGAGAVTAECRVLASRLRHRSAAVAARIAAGDVAGVVRTVAAVLGLPDPPAVPRPAGAGPADPRADGRAARLRELRSRYPRPGG
ncbi:MULTISPECIES: hypothetical protein [Catenuloplanes]|uniref:DUF4240 domain-containing protein n=1 Tax=Catenuloplanes niger TaxID=587534 RepID=A0AAE4CXT3_9ACTN|nr:hypothetical protein [Catenuloplanes niger]MDR7326923.1 hypothetical protein [Catenuloplanes niger]